jgi:hypothetical protein
MDRAIMKKILEIMNEKGKMNKEIVKRLIDEAIERGGV